MTTWILLKNIPPELYGINLEKWEKAKTTIIWKKRQVKTELLNIAEKRGAVLLKQGKEYSLIREPSRKEDTAGDIFREISVRPKIDEQLTNAFKEVTKCSIPIEKHQSYYSSKFNVSYSANLIKKGTEGEIDREPKKDTIGTQSIILRFVLNDLYNGILTISYNREADGTYKYEGSVLARQNEGKMDLTQIPHLLGLPSTFKLPEAEIKRRVFEE